MTTNPIPSSAFWDLCFMPGGKHSPYIVHHTPYTKQTVRRHFICKYSNILVTAIKIILFFCFYVALLFCLLVVSHLWFRHQVVEWVSAIKCQIFNRLWNYRYKQKLCLSSSTSSSSNQSLVNKALNHGVIFFFKFFPSFCCFQLQQFFINFNFEYAFFPVFSFFFLCKFIDNIIHLLVSRSPNAAACTATVVMNRILPCQQFN